ncbi:XRE family transcriptional regulator [Acinetobacter soli]|uniref:XRE family transcriptional regulator n=1 Tax=Acinetobacter soli TaxID=487316 RepID=UPI00124F9431|nr:XRE family transcriptional regulator [Acinetobacter soli]MBU3121365.1 XRE family transcriptional regulator [Acinetobacter soli]
MTKETADLDKLKVNQLIGKNCESARLWAGLNRKTAMQRIFQYKDENQLNRITELENGQKTLTAPVLLKLCKTYNCSADFILGISNEVELNYAASHNGLIVESITSAALEMADNMSMSLSKMLKHMPRYEGEVLHTCAKNLIKEIDVHAHDLAFKGSHPAIIDAAGELRQAIIEFEIVIAKMARCVELNMIQHIENYERQNLSPSKDLLTKPQVNEIG